MKSIPEAAAALKRGRMTSLSLAEDRLEKAEDRLEKVANFLDKRPLSIPCHGPGDPPVGLMLMDEHGQDRHLLAAGLAVERILSH